MMEVEYDNEKEYNETVDKLTATAVVSIAISLKRIADAMTKKIVVPELSPDELEKLKEEYTKSYGIVEINR